MGHKKFKKFFQEEFDSIISNLYIRPDRALHGVSGMRNLYGRIYGFRDEGKKVEEFLDEAEAIIYLNLCNQMVIDGPGIIPEPILNEYFEVAFDEVTMNKDGYYLLCRKGPQRLREYYRNDMINHMIDTEQKKKRTERERQEREIEEMLSEFEEEKPKKRKGFFKRAWLRKERDMMRDAGWDVDNNSRYDDLD